MVDPKTTDHRSLPASPTTCFARASRGISDLITKPGVINLDFADVQDDHAGGWVGV